MNEYLTKPLDKKLLLSMVHKCATTTPVLHPNLNRIIEDTPDSEIGNPLDNTNKNSPGIRETRRNSQGSHQDHSDGRRPMSRGASLRASTCSG
jgi:hypothetical protein